MNIVKISKLVDLPADKYFTFVVERSKEQVVKELKMLTKRFKLVYAYQNSMNVFLYAKEVNAKVPSKEGTKASCRGRSDKKHHRRVHTH